MPHAAGTHDRLGSAAAARVKACSVTATSPSVDESDAKFRRITSPVFGWTRTSAAAGTVAWRFPPTSARSPRRRRAHAPGRIRHHQSQRRRRRGPRGAARDVESFDQCACRLQFARASGATHSAALRARGTVESIAVPTPREDSPRRSRRIGRTDRRRTRRGARAHSAPRRTHRRRVVRRRGGFSSVLDVTPYAKHLRRCATSAATVASTRTARSGAQPRAPRRRREVPAGARILGKRATSRSIRDAIERRHHGIARGGVRGGGDRSRGRTAHQRADRASVARHVARRVSDARERRREERVHLGGGAWLPPSWRTCASVFRRR